MSSISSSAYQEVLNKLFEAARTGDDHTVLSFVPSYQTENKYSSTLPGANNIRLNALTVVEPSSNMTVAHVAASNGHLRLCRLLLERGMPVDVLDNTHLTPMRHAASNHHIDIVRLCLDWKANADSADVNGQTALFGAIVSDDDELLHLLLDRGASVSVEDCLGKTPISLAKSKGKGKMVALLNARRQSNQKSVPLSDAEKSTSRGALVVVKDEKSTFEENILLVKKLFEAVKKADAEIFMKLLSSHHSQQQEHEEEEASSSYANSHEKAGKILLTAVDPDDKSNERKNLLHTACFVGSLDITRILLEEYSLPLETAAPGGKRFTPLDFACETCFDVPACLSGDETRSGKSVNLELVEYLLQRHCANPNHQDIHGQTVLHRACSIVGNSNQDLVGLLLKNDANVDIQDFNFKTPLDLARIKGKNAVVKMIQNHVDMMLRRQNNASLAAARRATTNFATTARGLPSSGNTAANISPERRANTNNGNSSPGNELERISMLESSQNHMQRELLGCRNEMERLRGELMKSRDEVGQLKIQKEASESRNRTLSEENEVLKVKIAELSAK